METAFCGEVRVRGFSALTDNGDKFLLVPNFGRNTWDIYGFLRGHKFQVTMISSGDLAHLNDWVEDNNVCVGDDGNGVFWYSYDMGMIPQESVQC